MQANCFKCLVKMLHSDNTDSREIMVRIRNMSFIFTKVCFTILWNRYS